MDRYEEALERAKAGLPMDEVFPELKESEDERIRKWLIGDIDRRLSCWTSKEVTREEVLAWLEKQKAQQPAEWSEEDEQWHEAIVKDYEDSLTKDKDHAAVIKIKIDFLKSLRPQPHWKPSEEQITALGCVRYVDRNCAAELESLYEDLKKL